VRSRNLRKSPHYPATVLIRLRSAGWLAGAVGFGAAG